MRRQLVSAQSRAAALISRRWAVTPLTGYAARHMGMTTTETEEMLKTIGFDSLDTMMESILPKNIVRPPLPSIPALSEHQALDKLRSIMSRNVLHKSCIGQGYYDTLTPPVIIRNVLESPGWYTPYTPYQAEISQGRLESLLNYQTLITELTKMDYSNASLLDEAVSAAEAMHLSLGHHRFKKKKFFVASSCYQASISMIQTRAVPFGCQVIVGDINNVPLDDPELCGIVVQTPDANGALHDFTELFAAAKKKGVVSACATDLMACIVTKPAGEMGADIVFGNSQRFGVPLGYGGPHASFFACKDEYKRLLPGRMIGISKDSNGKPALRMALQTREQHIRREKATSNICTAQALLANMAAMYGIYHGPKGLTQIATRIHDSARALVAGLKAAGHSVKSANFFDTIVVDLNKMTASEYVKRCQERGINIRMIDNEHVGISLDEATSDDHLIKLLEAAGLKTPDLSTCRTLAANTENIPAGLKRTSKFMTQKIFNTIHNETEMMRYIYSLQRKDYGLNVGMVPLGSCTMKLNPAASMIPMSWKEIGGLHPLVPEDQARGYFAMARELEAKLVAITGLAAVSLQPNSGSQGEYAGLRTIDAYHKSRGEGHRKVCLIPQSAHGTNPATAALCGMTIETINCLPDGTIDMNHLEQCCKKHEKVLSCIMITYPSTYGVFDEAIQDITEMVHKHGGQCYIDGANFNAMVGVTGPGFFGGDVCHINMHKTFSIPHGGGGPGMGPIGVREHLAPFLPNSTGGAKVGGDKAFGQVSQAAYGSASILNISYMEMIMLGSEGMTAATKYAILASNYLMKRLEPHYPILFRGKSGRCAHEFIIDARDFKKTAGIEAEDIAKRLMDYGFHAPTLSFPVAGTLMIEPTESEPLSELNRFADAMISIRGEIRDIEEGRQPKEGNVLKHAPHTAEVICANEWTRPYTRELAAFPVPSQRSNKFWPQVGRLDGTYGDRNLMCACSE